MCFCSADGTAQTRSHNQQNEITAVSGATTPAYDANGNLTTDETGKQFVYDAWNRLVTVKNSGGTTLETFAYDGHGWRVTATAGGTTTDLYYSSSWQVLEERVSGTATAQYVWSPIYVDALLLRDRDTDANGSLDERRWVQQDANFNVTALLDNSGNVVERYAYDSYGKFTIYDASWGTRSSSSYAWVYQHQGLRFDATAGLYHARARDLSPSLGRWLQKDPAGFGAGDVDLYRAYGNEPTGGLDPSGMCDAAQPVSFLNDAGAFIDKLMNDVADTAMDIFLSQTLGDLLNDADQLFAGWGQALTGGLTTMIRDELYGQTATQNHQGTLFSIGVGIGTAHSIMMGGLGLGGQGANWAVKAALMADAFMSSYTGGLGAINIATGHGTFADVVAVGASLVSLGGIAASFPNCFPADTPIATEHGPKPIQAIRASDRVWAFDHVTGEWKLRSVIETYRHEHDGDLVTATVAGEDITSTGHHPFWVVRGEALANRPQPEHVPEAPDGSRIPGRWVDAIDLQVGDVLLLRSGEQAAITQLVIRHAREMVYNFQVEELHCYAVGPNQILVHNNSYPSDAAGIQKLANDLAAAGYKPTQVQGKMKKDAIEQIAALLTQDASGFWGTISKYEKVIIGPSGEILDGHHRLIASVLSGQAIPEDQIIRYAGTVQVPTYNWVDVLPH